MPNWFSKASDKKKAADNAVKRYRSRNPDGDLPRALHKAQIDANAELKEATDNRNGKNAARASRKTKAMNEKLKGGDPKRGRR